MKKYERLNKSILGKSKPEPKVGDIWEHLSTPQDPDLFLILSYKNGTLKCYEFNNYSASSKFHTYMSLENFHGSWPNVELVSSIESKKDLSEGENEEKNGEKK